MKYYFQKQFLILLVEVVKFKESVSKEIPDSFCHVELAKGTLFVRTGKANDKGI
ncbi:MAG: hypothetical protein LBL79_14475 [Prevotella sp.]|jgi:hypothetical protein|nr:hypothetical protein [Prevotella sp.]